MIVMQLIRHTASRDRSIAPSKAERDLVLSLSNSSFILNTVTYAI